jgi:hypothetical protein
MEQDGTPPAIFEDMDGYLRITWLNIDSDIRRIIKKANAEQVELENQTTPQETLSHQLSTLNSQTMPLIIKGDPQVINHYEGAHYENCTFINGTPTTQSPIVDNPITLSPDNLITSLPDNPLPIAHRSSPDLDKFRSLLTIPYLNRKRECEAMLELITRDGYNKKDRARMALALYQSGNVALKREHITTFRQWWRICCELLLWDGADTCYRTTELTENELTKQILSYM